jgi:hypothetical protein
MRLGERWMNRNRCHAKDLSVIKSSPSWTSKFKMMGSCVSRYRFQTVWARYCAAQYVDDLTRRWPRDIKRHVQAKSKRARRTCAISSARL